jgi:hypothetical protein
VLTLFEEVKVRAVKIGYILNKLFIISQLYSFCVLGLFKDELTEI